MLNYVTKVNGIVILVAAAALGGCIKKSDKNQSPGPVAVELQNKTVPFLLEPQPMKLCVRPVHRLGVKKCVRNGKWVRFSLAANDVDNDRSDVFTNPRISLKKENFYPDTFRFLDGIQHTANYPDFYHSVAAYGGFSHFVFAMPSQPDLAVTYGYAGRDEVRENLKRSLSAMNPATKEFVKIQHWNDGSTFKKFALIYFELIGDYTETNFRYECTWAEQDQGYDFSQLKTKEGVEIPKIPETYVWRKISESCEQLPSRSADGEIQYLPFKELNQNAITKDHQFTAQNRNKIKIYSVKATSPEEVETKINTLQPMIQSGMKMDGSTSMFLNSRKEEISRWESIYEEDLKDASFQPERTQ